MNLIYDPEEIRLFRFLKSKVQPNVEINAFYNLFLGKYYTFKFKSKGGTKYYLMFSFRPLSRDGKRFLEFRLDYIDSDVQVNTLSSVREWYNYFYSLFRI